MPATDKLTTIGTDLELALSLITGVVAAASTNPLAQKITSAASIIAAGLEKLIAEHNLAITYGELEALRTQEQWPDAPAPTPPTGT